MSSPVLGGCVIVHAPADNADHVVDVEVIVVPRVDALMVPATQSEYSHDARRQSLHSAIAL